MAPVGPFRSLRRTPDSVRRHIDVAGARAWDAVVLAHTDEALRFARLLTGRLGAGQAIERYLDEMDVRDPMASAVRSRALMTARSSLEEDPDVHPELALDEEGEGLKRFRPDRVVRGIRKKVKEAAGADEILLLAIARAEETILRVHIQNATELARFLREHQPLDEAIEDYIDLMRITGGRAQAVYQRAMAQLADHYLPDDAPTPE